MAVIVKYVVVRDGKEDMMFASKKEADAYDKMLDTAEGLYDYLHRAALGIPDEQLDALTFFMAQHRDEVGRLLKGGTIAQTKPKPAPTAEDTEEVSASSEAKDNKATKRPRATESKSAAA